MKPTVIVNDGEIYVGAAVPAHDLSEEAMTTPTREWFMKAAASEPDDVACPYCGAIAGACPDYPNCPNGEAATTPTPRTDHEDHRLNPTRNPKPVDTMDTTENAQSVAAPAIPFDLAADEHYAGLSRDHETGVWHHVVLLPATTDKDLTWQEAIDWAKSVGGELPTRFESALLYANPRDKIDHNYWYWTATTHEREPLWAWLQDFYYGGQIYTHKDGHLRARAVRRVPFTEEA